GACGRARAAGARGGGAGGAARAGPAAGSPGLVGSSGGAAARRGGGLAALPAARADSVPRIAVSAFHDPLTRVARRSRTCAADGFVRAVPSENTIVGTV